MTTTTLTGVYPRPTLDPQSPFPGLAAYRELDREFFYGRSRESDELFRRVRRGVLTVCFGASGLGKSSLLAAGLFPRLRKELLLPVPVRLDFGPQAGELNAQVMARIADEIAAERVEAEGPEGVETLWEYFHRTRLWNPRNRLLAPVLVFDQFEEIFTLGRADARVDRLVEALADLVENRIPATVRRRIADGDELDFSYERPTAKVVLALREDFLPHLEELRDRLPSLASNRFRLTRMRGPQALEAVLEPGREVVEEAVAREIVLYAVGATDESRATAREAGFESVEVEPALLNLICRELNALRLKKKLPRITSKLLAGARRQILTTFYERSLAGLGGAARNFVEDKLLTTSGYRKAEPVEEALATPGLGVKALEKLVDRRLLRQEERLGIPHVELIHDVLTHVVLESRTRRREREAARRRQKRRWAVGSTATAAVLLALVGVSLWGARQSAMRLKLEQVQDQASATIAALKYEHDVLSKEQERLSEEAGGLYAEVTRLQHRAESRTGSGEEFDKLKGELEEFQAYVKQADDRAGEGGDQVQQSLDSYKATRRAAWAPGDAGEVAAIQKKLNLVLGRDLRVDGQWGAATEAAVEDFQRLNGLTVDGVPGPKTLKVLDAAKTPPRMEDPPGVVTERPRSGPRTPGREQVALLIHKSYSPYIDSALLAAPNIPRDLLSRAAKRYGVSRPDLLLLLPGDFALTGEVICWGRQKLRFDEIRTLRAKEEDEILLNGLELEIDHAKKNERQVRNYLLELLEKITSVTAG